MRDRVFDGAWLRLRLTIAGGRTRPAAGSCGLHRELGKRRRVPGGRGTSAREGNLGRQGSPAQPFENKSSGERGERGEPFSTLTHTRTRAHAMEKSEKGSPRSPGSPKPANSEGYGGEPGGEPLEGGSHGAGCPTGCGRCWNDASPRHRPASLPAPDDQTTTASTAKHQAAVALHHQQPRRRPSWLQQL